ncbi:fused MFS/spermidine synthase [bacterium]|nr:fused MFS/spermidine synthase [bacterium]
MPVAAAWFVARRSGAPARTARALLVALVLLLAVAAWRPQVRILPPSFGRFDREVLFYDETVEGTVTVGRDRDTRSQAKYTYVNNSAVIGSSYDAVKVVKMVGHFPFLVRPGLRDVLVIGFGIGVTTSAIAAHPEVRSITCVELVPGLKEAASYYRELNRDVVADPRLTIVRGDGRRRLQASARKYDLISCDPTHPVLGSGNLYTREYFELCRSRLNPGGLVSQYLPLHKLRSQELMGLIATFHDVFPDCAVWLGHYHAVLLGSTAPLRVDFGDWAARAAALGEDPSFYGDPYHLAATLVLDGPAIARLSAGARLNTDDRSYTEFFAPGCLDEANLSANLRYLQERRVGVGAVFEGIPDPALMARFVEGNRLLTESLVRQTGGDPRGGLQALQQAVRANPEDQEYPFLIRMAR